MDTLSISWNILCDTAIYVLAGFFIAGLLQAWLSGTQAIAWLSERSRRSVFLATMIGMPLPLCSCGVLPSAVTLRKKGASKGATLSFLISTPETSVTSILLTYALLGPLMAVFRPVAACISALVAGFVENFVEQRAERRRSEDAPAPAPDSDAGETCCDCAEKTAEQPVGESGVRAGIRYAFTDLFDAIFHWIIIGIVIAAAIQAFLPPVVFRGYFASPWLSMLLMLVVGIPLYVCAEASTPIAAALIAQGMNPGAALILLLVGPATNIGAVGVLNRALGRGTVVRYLVIIAIVSLLMGLVLSALVSVESLALDVRAFEEPLLPYWLKAAGAIGFLLLGLFTMRRRQVWPRLLAWLDAHLPVPVTQRSLLTTTGVLAVLVYVGSGFFAVQPGEVGIVRRFGAIVHGDLGPGLHYRWPYPIETADRVPVRQVNRLELGFRVAAELENDGAAAGEAPAEPMETIPDEAWVLVGDENIADIKSAVHWGAIPEQAIRFQYGAEDRSKLVRSVGLGAVREVLGDRSINRGFTSQRRDCEAAIEQLIRERIAAYGCGIRIDSFHFLDAHAPPEVHDAFRDVASALEDKSTQINLALRDEARIVPLARGDAEKLREEADGYAAGTVAASKGEAQRFLDLLAPYAQWPAVTRKRLYFETMDKILAGKRKYIRTTGAGAGEIEIWLLDPAIGRAMPWTGAAEEMR